MKIIVTVKIEKEACGKGKIAGKRVRKEEEKRKGFVGDGKGKKGEEL